MSNQRFPYERSRWRSGERDTARQWHEALERVGVESVRIRLTQVNCSSASAVALGTARDEEDDPCLDQKSDLLSQSPS
jgi:hypothetical protein